MGHLTEADLQAWIDRELPPEDQARANGHLEDCADCRRELGDLRRSSEMFSTALHAYDDDLTKGRRATGHRAGRGGARVTPGRVGRAAVIFLVVAGAAAAAVVPGSPLRGLWDRDAVGPPSIVVPAPVTQPAAGVPPTGASITVRPRDDRLTVRVRDFAPRTRVVIRLTEGSAAVATLPDGAENARFIVASGVLELVGPGARTDESGEAEEIEILLPRSLVHGAVEVDGTTAVLVKDGELIMLRPDSGQSADEAVFDIGG